MGLNKIKNLISISSVFITCSLSYGEHDSMIDYASFYHQHTEYLKNHPDAGYSIPNGFKLHALPVGVMSTQANTTNHHFAAYQWSMYKPDAGIMLDEIPLNYAHKNQHDVYVAIIDTGTPYHYMKELDSKLNQKIGRHFWIDYQKLNEAKTEIGNPPDWDEMTDDINSVSDFDMTMEEIQLLQRGNSEFPDELDSLDDGIPLVVDNHITDRGSYHGSHVAGIIGANGPYIHGVTGFDKHVKILPIKALEDNGSGDTNAILEAVLWAAGSPEAKAGVNPNPAKVINLSLGMSRVDAGIDEFDWFLFVMPMMCHAWEYVVNEANKMGSTVVIAAGNDGHELWNDIPSGCPNLNAIVVEATGPTGKRSFYSTYASDNWFTKSTIIKAPGGDSKIDPENGKVLSTVNGRYAFFQGTSMAAPHVSGIVALLYRINPSISYKQVASILSRSYQENGVISAKYAINLAQKELTIRVASYDNL
ncbi:S8 family serine peptidase [Cysteiniphilum sp. JM-1]|uniref:S8 family serine peptidase n=1 Tax=Cysteiniphilum sp. JM-1 TaxID=2610891 RepID=UPI00168D58E6|nr:S8 family serine peptidase [Cysteiniphilum sp. JM-1]